MTASTRTITCRDCSKIFPAPGTRGRPPVRCDACKMGKMAATLHKPVKAEGDDASVRMAKARAARTNATPEAPVALATVKQSVPSQSHRPVGREAQCVSCFRVFSSDSVCEKHKYYAAPKTVECKVPSNLGMTAVLKRDNVPVWVWVNSDEAVVQK